MYLIYLRINQMGRAEHLVHKCINVYNTRLFKFSDENLRMEHKYKSIFVYKFTVVTVKPRTDFALHFHRSTG
jgi:hypothetical protein